MGGHDIGDRRPLALEIRCFKDGLQLNGWLSRARSVVGDEQVIPDQGDPGCPSGSFSPDENPKQVDGASGTSRCANQLLPGSKNTWRCVSRQLFRGALALGWQHLERFGLWTTLAEICRSACSTSNQPLGGHLTRLLLDVRLVRRHDCCETGRCHRGGASEQSSPDCYTQVGSRPARIFCSLDHYGFTPYCLGEFYWSLLASLCQISTSGRPVIIWWGTKR